MGGGASKETVAATTTKDVDVMAASAHEIDMKFLFCGLEKLSCTFELQDTLGVSFSDSIMDSLHLTLDDQFMAAKAWIAKNSDVHLTYNEINELIKYVKLYEAPERQNVMSEAEPVKRASHFDCPYRSSLAKWEKEIRSKEATRFSFCEKSITKENTVDLRQCDLDSERVSVRSSSRTSRGSGDTTKWQEAIMKNCATASTAGPSSLFPSMKTTKSISWTLTEN